MARVCVETFQPKHEKYTLFNFTAERGKTRFLARHRRKTLVQDRRILQERAHALKK